MLLEFALTPTLSLREKGRTMALSLRERVG
jgi:hypothetical protein